MNLLYFWGAYFISILVVLYANRLYRSRYGESFLPEGYSTIFYLSDKYGTAFIWPVYFAFAFVVWVIILIGDLDSYLRKAVKKRGPECKSTV